MATRAAPDGFEVTLHRSLTEPILMGGAPRAVAISIGTLAAAIGIGLQLWIVGAGFWVSRPYPGRLGGQRDHQFADVCGRHLRIAAI